MALTRYVRKNSYDHAAPPDYFMVSLLRNQITDVLNQYATGDSGDRQVLDVGCGEQPFRDALNQLGYRYISADVEQNSKATVDIICSIDHPLPPALIAQAPFEFIFCTEVMEHVADWHMAFHNFAQLLASGGRLFITCPHFFKLHEEPYDFWRPTPYALQYFGEKYHLEILHQVNAGDAWDILGTVIASVWPKPVTPTPQNYLLSKAVGGLRKLLIRALLADSVRSSVRLEGGPFYLSNIVVFEKQ